MQIVLLLVLVCVFAAPVMAKPKDKKTSKKASTDKTVIKKVAAKNVFDADAPELTLEASAAIDRGLKFLLSRQNKDGSWDSDGKGGHAVAITSLGLMAFMSKAQFPGSGPYAEQLDRAKDFLLNQTKKGVDGYLGSVMYEHGLATLALSEMWGMTRDAKDDDKIQKALEAAVDVILRSQSAAGGWRYQPQRDGGQDTSVTVMIFVALASARQAGIMVPNETIKKVVKYFHIDDSEI
jgi:ribosome-binding factor A